MKKDQNILLFGQASYLNRGCEALITTISNLAKEEGPDNSITVATFDIESDKKYHGDLVDKYVEHRYRSSMTKEEESRVTGNKEVEALLQKKVTDEVSCSDVCMSIGGDNYCYSGQLDFLYTIDKDVRKKHKKLVLFGASIDDDVINPEFIKDIRRFDVVSVRESITFELLSSFVDKRRLLLSPDTAFTLKSKKVALPPGFPSKKGVVGINLSPLIMNYQGEDSDVLRGAKKLIDHILREHPYEVALIPHVYVKGGDDLDVLRKIKDYYKDNDRVILFGENKYSCGELKYIISKCRFLVAARTHASIAGYSTNVPTLVLGYSIKSKGIAKDIFGNYQDYVLPVQELRSGDEIIEKFEILLKNEQVVKKLLEDKMPSYIKRAGESFRLVTKTLEKLEIEDVTRPEECTGCGACASACPQGAIEMKLSEEGFQYPVISQKICVDCGTCRRICPVNSQYENKYKDLGVYACKNRDEAERLVSSSGGVFVLLAKEFFSGGGIVYGATIDKLKLKHIRIDDAGELEKVRGSKYAESEIGDIYQLVKSDLENDKRVLFSGTPCQIEGLRHFLAREYPALTCVSVFCHGVPSRKVLAGYLSTVEDFYGSKIAKINFRDKSKGWKNYGLEYTFESGERVRRDSKSDLFMIGFLKDYYLRSSCYSCEFKLSKKNTSDIILGDLWGVEQTNKEIDDDKGVSAVIINSSKGRDIFDKIKNGLDVKKIKIAQVTQHNPSLVSSSPINLFRYNFFKLFETVGFEMAVDFLHKADQLDGYKKKTVDNEEKIGELELNAEKLQYELSRSQAVVSEMEKSRRWRYTEIPAKAYKAIRNKGKSRGDE
jgi:coenzyme F420-reducing hydrogenase beta subunit/polysaccharide pyruvyl transferase WcaK-like protein